MNETTKTVSKTRAATPKQIAALVKFGVEFDPQITMAEASEMIEQAIAKRPATDKQKALLTKWNVSFDPKITGQQASELIAESASSGRFSSNGLSLADLESYDPGAKSGKTWRRFCCPLCRKKISPEHRDLGANMLTGAYKCHACGAKGILVEFRKRPEFQPQPRAVKQNRFRAAQTERKPARFDLIPFDRVRASLNNYDNNHFVQFLLAEFDRESVNKAVARYLLGTSNKQTIFWQIDRQSKVRTGKVISYDPHTGKRVKKVSMGWIHARMIKAGELPESFRLAQCFFGEHLLRASKLPIAIVESEKSAVIASIFVPQYTWLASGAKLNLQPEKLVRIATRRIILVPDADAFWEWSELAKEAREAGFDVVVFDLLEKEATAEEKEKGIDLADWLIECNRSDRAEAAANLASA
jgi:hypothetical protein